MSDDVKPYTTLAEIGALEAAIDGASPNLRFSNVEDIVRRLLATAKAGLADRERLDWLEQNAKLPDDERVILDAWERKPGDWQFRQKYGYRTWETLRAAIDASRGVHPAGPESEGAASAANPAEIPTLRECTCGVGVVFYSHMHQSGCSCAESWNDPPRKPTLHSLWHWSKGVPCSDMDDDPYCRAADKWAGQQEGR